MSHNLLGLNVQIRSLSHFLDLFIQPLLGLVHSPFSLRFSLFFLFHPLLDEVPSLVLNPFQGSVSNALAAQGYEGFISDQDIDRVEKEGDVVEIEILQSACSDLKELLGNKVQIGDD